MLGRSLLLKVRRPQPVYPDYVQEYISRVIAADVAAGSDNGLEYETTDAISTCLQALVADGILGVSGGVLSQSASLIKAGCFMMGARTLSGALVPLAADMPAPTNFGFGNGAYNRRTGLIGDGGTTYLDSNRPNNADPQNSKHMSVYLNSALGLTTAAIGAQSSATASRTFILRAGGDMDCRVNNVSAAFSGAGTSTGFVGCSRATSTSISRRVGGVTTSASANSIAPTSFNTFVFCRNLDGVANIYTSARISFYSIGENLDLAVLDARITALSNAIQATIAP